MRRHACLALKRIQGRCTYDIIAEVIDLVMAEYGLNNKVSHCITDSGSNFLKAFAEFHTSPDESNQDVDEDDTDTDTSNEEAILLSEVLTNGPADTEDTYSLPAHFRCAAHRLNLIAASDAQEPLLNPRCKRTYRSLMGKVTELFNKQSRSSLASDKIKEVLGGLFIVNNSTRWNSLFDALTRVKEYYMTKRAGLNSIFVEFKLAPFTDDEVTLLKEYLMVMEPLATALDLLQGEKEVSIGYLLPTLREILYRWKITSETEDVVFTSALLAHLKASVERRFELELKSEDLILAAAVHPMFKLHWLASPEEVDEVSVKVRRKLVQYNDTDNTTTGK